MSTTGGDDGADHIDASLVKALGHPLRLRILELFLDRGETTPIAVARDLGRPISTVSRHVRLLRDLGFLELTRTEPRRGTIVHFYRATRAALLDDATWDRLPVAMRRGLVGQTFRRLFLEGSDAGGHGGFDGNDARLQRMPLALDETGWQELGQAIDTFLLRAEQLQRESDVRRDEHEGDTSRRPSVVGVMHFATGVGSDEATGRPRLGTPRAGH